MNIPLEASYFDWDDASSSLVYWGKKDYFYSEINITSAPKTVVSDMDIYPNPVSDYIKVFGFKGFATFKLYNLQGKVILTKTLAENETVNVSHLSAGIYPYNFIADRKQQSGMLIKK
jgi:hypothetical protein